MKKILLFLFVALFSGCVVIQEAEPERVQLKANQRISTEGGSISLQAPLDKNLGVFYEIYHNQEGLYLYWATKGMIVEKLWIKMRDKVDQYPQTKREFVDYIDGVKCRTFEKDGLAQIYSHTINGEKTYTKEYETYCPFNDRVVKMSYEYSYNTKSEAFTNYGYSEDRMLETIRNVFRADIQTIFSTIKFNVDREKMQKSGLISEEKAYRVKF